MESLEEKLKEAEEAAEKHHDSWLRAAAELENVRKRTRFEVADAHKYALETFARELLVVVDSLEAAVHAEDATTIEALERGVLATLAQLNAVFEKFHLTEIDPLGQPFDPKLHQALTMVEASAEPNTVVQVMQKGYLLHDRLIRAALVTVAR